MKVLHMLLESVAHKTLCLPGDGIIMLRINTYSQMRCFKHSSFATNSNRAASRCKNGVSGKRASVNLTHRREKCIPKEHVRFSQPSINVGPTSQNLAQYLQDVMPLFIMLIIPHGYVCFLKMNARPRATGIYIDLHDFSKGKSNITQKCKTILIK